MDWKNMIARLAEAGLTQTRIAELCGVKQSTISDIARGITKCPSFAIGSRLQQLVNELPANANGVAESAPGEQQAAGQGA